MSKGESFGVEIKGLKKTRIHLETKLWRKIKLETEINFNASLFCWKQRDHCSKINIKLETSVLIWTLHYAPRKLIINLETVFSFAGFHVNSDVSKLKVKFPSLYWCFQVYIGVSKLMCISINVNFEAKSDVSKFELMFPSL